MSVNLKPCPFCGGERMNHDNAHCLDFRPDCPKDCFRAQLNRDLKSRIDMLGLPFAWMRFKGTKECKRKESK